MTGLLRTPHILGDDAHDRRRRRLLRAELGAPGRREGPHPDLDSDFELYCNVITEALM